MNYLYYGDNLDVLRRHIADESVDLVYLDPPFNSDQNYNVLFAEQDGSRSAAQIHAFEDTWRWDQAAAASFQDVVEGGGRVSIMMQAFRQAIGESDMLAYLAMMAPRLSELHRALKATGSIYLHCDPTASHYLKLLMDAIFGPRNYRNDIVWRRSINPKGSQHKSRRYGVYTDNILFYGKSDRTYFNLDAARVALTPEQIEGKYDRRDEKGPFYDGPILRAPSMGLRPNLVYEYKGFTPGPEGWRVRREELEQLDRQGDIGWPEGGKPYRKLRPENDRGAPVGSLWDDISLLNSQAAERLGYPTQKPEALLERIIRASSEEGDTVLDPFCGCGTTIAAAQHLKRQWIGIDITHLAVGLIKHRLHDAFSLVHKRDYKVIGEPTDLAGARQLASEDTHQFEHWALGLVYARKSAKGKGADKGIDGRMYFHDEGEAGPTKQVILSVKSGKLKATDVRDLRGVIDREKAAIGVLISMDEPTAKMRTEVATAGFYESPWGKQKHPRMQLFTVEELLDGAGIDMPPVRQTGATFRRARKKKSKSDKTQQRLL